MILNFSRSDVGNTTLTDANNLVVFAASTPWQFGTKTTTIRWFQDGRSGTILHDAVLAKIAWYKLFQPRPIIWLYGVELDGKDFIKESWWTMKFTFTGPDGLSYKWKTNPVISLELDDGSRTPVARFHHRSLGILNTAHPPYLEIFPLGEHMVDLIVVTLIYVETIKLDRQRRRRRQP